MSFTKKTFIQIYESMVQDTKDRLPQITDFEEGGIIRSLYESFAFEIAVLYEQIEIAYKAGFIDTAEESDLERVVEILGITRNEPDYALGEVTFTRDVGIDEDITIPIGTIVTTKEDQSKDPSKKSYLTIEECTVAAGEQSVTTRIQAQYKGSDMVTDPETIVIMPLPVYGVKTVINENAIVFTGKEKETDTQLRQRAKKALIASGKASAASIEIALIGMAGVKGATVKEDTPGVIEIYVDGLNDQNKDQIEEQVNKVKAAGIYYNINASVYIDVNIDITLRLEQELSDNQSAEIIDYVKTALTEFIENMNMGQTLFISRLVNIPINVNGVIDVYEIRISIVKDSQDAEKIAENAKQITADIMEKFIPGQITVSCR